MLIPDIFVNCWKEWKAKLTNPSSSLSYQDTTQIHEKSDVWGEEIQQYLHHFTQRNPRTFIKKLLKFSININLLWRLIVMDRVGGVRLLKACRSRFLYIWSIWDRRISWTRCSYCSWWQQIRQNKVALAESSRSMLNVSKNNIRNIIYNEQKDKLIHFYNL